MSIVFFCIKKLCPQQRRFFSCSPEKKSSNIRTRLYFAKERPLSKDCEGKMAWKTAVSFRISLSILWWTTNFFHGHYLKCIKNFREKFIWLDNILQFPLVLLEKTTASIRDRISVWIRQILGRHKVIWIRLGISKDNALNFVLIQYSFFLSAKKMK